MEPERNGRKGRAMRLSAEALELLKRRLDADWEGLDLGRRLTLNDSAALMDVSKGSAHKILHRSGNDRAVLEHAFKSLDLTWHEHFAEPMEARDRTGVPAEDLFDNSLLGETQLAGRRWLLRAKPVVGLVAVLAIILVVGSQARSWLDSTAIANGKRVRYAEIDAARSAFNRADYDTAHKHSEKALRLAKQSWDANALSETLGIQGDIYSAIGRLEDAVDCYQEALKLRTSFQYAGGRALMLEALGVLEARLGRLDQAEKHLQESLAQFQTAQDPGGIAMASRGLGSVAAVRGDISVARVWYDAATAAVADRVGEAIHTDLKALRALLARDEGNFDLALRELEDCLAYWSRQRHPRWQAATLMQIASVHRAAGQEPGASAATVRAKALYESVGDRRGVEVCSEFLDRPTYTTRKAAFRLEEFF